MIIILNNKVLSIDESHIINLIENDTDLHTLYKSNSTPITNTIVEQYLYDLPVSKLFWRLFKNTTDAGTGGTAGGTAGTSATATAECTCWLGLSWRFRYNMTRLLLR